MRSGLVIAAIVAIGSACAARAAQPAAPAPKSVYRLAAAIPFKGKAPGWDYLTLDAKTGRLFIGRRADGVTVFDTRSGKVIKTIARSKLANGAVLVPEFGRGYTANEDGTVTIFRLSDLATLDRIKLGDSADAAYYDPASKLVIVTRGDDHRLTFIDARTGKPTGDLMMQANELEGVAADGHGGVFVSERDKTKVARIDPVSRTVTAEWDIEGGCTLPTGVGIDTDNHRLFLGCKGDHPLLAVLDTATGRTVATAPIGRGNDGVIYDPVNRRVLTANGVDGNVVILDQLDSDTYRLEQAITTRPIARTLAYDRETGTIYTAAAEGLVDPSRPVNTKAATFYPNAFYDDSFKLFIFKPQPYKPAAAADD